MNLLGFFAIVISVTGLIWLLQLLFKGKDRIDINLSVGRATDHQDKPPGQRTQSDPLTTSTNSEANDILGNVVLSKSFMMSQDKKPLPAEATQPNGDPSGPASKDQATKQPVPVDPQLDDSYIDKALEDEDFQDYSTESLLQEDPTGIGAPVLGQITLSPFSQIAAQLPDNSFRGPQNAEQIEAMFELLRENTSRIEQQMIALYAMVKSQSSPTSQAVTSAIETKWGKDQTTDDSSDYQFGDEDELVAPAFGGGLTKQFESINDENPAETQPAVEFLSLKELGGKLPADAFQTYDLSEITEPVEVERKELLPYLASLTKTGELSHDIVEAVKQKASTKVVRHRVRQLLRALDHYRLSNDSNAALRVTAVMSQLPPDLGKYSEAIFDIGRKFGMVEPSDEPEPVEADELIQD